MARVREVREELVMRGGPGSGLRYATFIVLTGVSVFAKIPRRIGCNSFLWKMPFRSKSSIGEVRDLRLCCWPVLEILPTSLTTSRPN